ncbi:PilZ domain-containing protein, partial [Xanthomonas sp. Kuri4-2]
MELQHPAESELFDGALSCELLQPAEFRLGNMPGGVAPAETLLRGLAQIEDLRSEDSKEERGDLPLMVQRMEAKLDLMLLLLGRLARQAGDALPLRPVRWSRHGIRLETGTRSGAMPGAAGVLSLQPVEWLPEQVALPVT